MRNLVDVNVKDELGQTALMTAALNGNLKVAQTLLKRGADVNARDNDRFGLEDRGPALRRAIGQGHLEIVRLLIDHGADVNAKAGGGMPPLSYAAYNNFLDIAQLLLDHGADPNRRNGRSRNRSTPLGEAASYGHPEMVKLLLERGAKVAASPMALIWAAQCRKASPAEHIAILRLLLHHGADINAKDVDGWTALMMAAGLSGRPELEVVKFLLDNGANIDAQDDEDYTALIIASKLGYTAVVRLLLEHGANPNLVNRHGKTALSWATEEDQNDVITLLLARGAQ